MADWGSENKYKCYDVHMKYQAGYAQMKKWSSGETQHSGTGWFHPFGLSHYYCGVGFDEAKDYPPEDYFSDYWNKEYDTSLFCVYRMEDGDIYAWDGVFAVRGKGIEEIPFDSVFERRDVVVNIIVGGTGAYSGARGIMIGTAEGAGEIRQIDEEESLPEVLIKDLQGYLKVPMEPK